MIKIIFDKKEKPKKDSKQKKKEFSKRIICIVAATAILGSVGTILATLFLGLPEVLACSIIAALGSVALTSIVFYYKKAQAENTIKLYLSSYNVILKLKKKYGNEVDSTLNEIETNMLGKISHTLDESITDATSMIEKQDAVG